MDTFAAGQVVVLPFPFSDLSRKKTQMTPAIINIVTAEQVGDFRIRLRFDDGIEQTVDFKSFLTHTLYPDIRA